MAACTSSSGTKWRPDLDDLTAGDEGPGSDARTREAGGSCNSAGPSDAAGPGGIAGSCGAGGSCEAAGSDGEAEPGGDVGGPDFAVGDADEARDDGDAGWRNRAADCARGRTASSDGDDGTGKGTFDGGPEALDARAAEACADGCTVADARTADRSRRGPMMRAARLNVLLVAVSYPSR